MININNNSYCLSVSNDRYNLLCDNFKKYKIEFPTKIHGYTTETIFVHSIPQIQHHMCSMGHIIMLHHAMIQNLDYCVIFEDDAYCHVNNIHDICNQLIYEINIDNADWDVLFLGYDAIYPDIHPYNNENVDSYDILIKRLRDKYMISETPNCMRLKTNKISGSHSLIIRNKCYKKMLYKIIDKQYFMDRLYCDDDIITYISKKSLFYQRQSNFIRKPYYHQYDIDIGPIFRHYYK